MRQATVSKSWRPLNTRWVCNPNLSFIPVYTKTKGSNRRSPIHGGQKLQTYIRVSKVWHSGLRYAWVSSRSFDPGIWFQNLKLLGNSELTSHVAMSVLLSGAQSYTYVSPKQASLMGTTLPHLSQPFSTPLFVQSMHLTASSPVFIPCNQYRCSHTVDHSGLLTPTYDNLFKILPSNVTLTQTNTGVIAYRAGEQRFPLPLEDLITTLNCKVYGSQMPIFDTYTSRLSSVGLCH
jgi:hypothetical protein